MPFKRPCLINPAIPVPTPASHDECMVCGRYSNLGVQFHIHGDSVEAQFPPKPEWQGYEGVLHGGMISTLLDAAMTHCLFAHGVEAMTADLQVRFLKPVPCSERLLSLRGRLLSKRRHLYHLSAELSSAGELLAWAEARFLPRKSS